MLVDIIRAVIASQPDLEFVGEVDKTGTVAEAVETGGIDALILGGRLSRARAVRLLCRVPRLTIITIDADGHGGAVHQFRLHRDVLHEISPTTLLTAIRGAADNWRWSATSGEREA